jgi:hypothetical protein
MLAGDFDAEKNATSKKNGESDVIAGKVSLVQRR